MTCEAWLAVMIDVTAGEATPEARAALEAHVAACPACAREFAAMQAANAQVARAAGSRAEAVAATAGLELYTPARRFPMRGWAIAAMVALAFAAGYAVRMVGAEAPWVPTPAVANSAPVKAASPAGEYARLHSASPALPAMARGLLSLARR